MCKAAQECRGRRCPCLSAWFCSSWGFHLAHWRVRTRLLSRNKGVERLPASVSAIFFFAQPLVGGLLSALLLHESLGLSSWLSGIVLAVGILLAG